MDIPRTLAEGLTVDFRDRSESARKSAIFWSDENHWAQTIAATGKALRVLPRVVDPGYLATHVRAEGSTTCVSAEEGQYDYDWLVANADYLTFEHSPRTNSWYVRAHLARTFGNATATLSLEAPAPLADITLLRAMGFISPEPGYSRPPSYSFTCDGPHR